MAMEFLKRIKKLKKITNYAISKRLTSEGIPMTIGGVDAYFKPGAKSMRLDVLCGLKRLSGESWETVGKWLDDEFLPNPVLAAQERRKR